MVAIAATATKSPIALRRLSGPHRRRTAQLHTCGGRRDHDPYEYAEDVKALISEVVRATRRAEGRGIAVRLRGVEVQSVRQGWNTPDLGPTVELKRSSHNSPGQRQNRPVQ
jgi:hypothetical protein